LNHGVNYLCKDKVLFGLLKLDIEIKND